MRIEVKSGKDFEVWLKKALKEVEDYKSEWGIYSDYIIEFLNSPYGRRAKEVIKDYIDEEPITGFRNFEMALWNNFTTEGLNDFINTWFDEKDQRNFYTFLNSKEEEVYA